MGFPPGYCSSFSKDLIEKRYKIHPFFFLAFPACQSIGPSASAKEKPPLSRTLSGSRKGNDRANGEANNYGKTLSLQTPSSTSGGWEEPGRALQSRPFPLHPSRPGSRGVPSPRARPRRGSSHSATARHGAGHRSPERTVITTFKQSEFIIG